MSEKKITVMIQARTSSSPLPGKVLSKIENKPMIWHVINRVKKIKSIQQIALITTREKSDQVLLKIAEENNLEKGIEPWRIRMGWSNEDETYTWAVTSTISKINSATKTKEMIINSNTEEVLSVEELRSIA